MPFEFSLHTAIVGTFGSSAILAAALYYLWRLEPAQRALRFWAMAFALQTLRMVAQLGMALGNPQLWILSDLLFAGVTLFLWLGTRALTPARSRTALLVGLLIGCIAWEFVAFANDLPFFVRSLPLYSVAGLILLLSARTVYRLERQQPDVGYRGLALLLALLGLHYFDYPFLRPLPWFAPIGFSVAAALMLSIGLAVLIITQRRQQFSLAETSRKLQQEMRDRQETEGRYRTLVEELEEGIIVVEADGYILLANPAAARMLAVPLESLRRGISYIRPYILCREDGSTLAEEEYPLRRALHHGEVSAARIYQMQRIDGSQIWLSINAHPLFQKDQPHPYAAIISFSDATARKAAERNLAASELRFRSIFEAVPNIAVQGYDRERKVIYWNKASEHFYGYGQQEALGRPIEELIVQPEEQADFRQQFETALAGGQAPAPGEYIARRKDGTAIQIYSTQVLINNLAGYPEVYCIDLDLSGIRRLESELQEASERFRAIAESSDLGVVVADPQGNFVYCNSRYLTLSASSYDDVLHGRWIHRLHPDDQKAMRDAWRQAIAAQTGFTMERRVISDAGETIWAQVHVAPIHPSAGEFRGFVATVEEITARKKAEAALRFSEGKFAGAFHGSLDYITISRLDTGEIIDANESFERISGWRREEVLGRSTLQLGIWPEPEARKQAVERLLQDGKLHEYPIVLGRKDGSRIDCVLSASIIDLGTDRFMLGVVRDITAQKAAAEALRQSEEKFSQIVRYSPVALMVTDAMTTLVVDLNDAWLAMFGYTREQAIGRTSIEFGLWVDPADRADIYAALKAGGDVLDRYECRYRKADGSAIFGLVSGRRFEFGGRDCYIWSVTDITLRHEMARQMAELNTQLEARVAARTRELQQTQDELIRSEKLAALGSLVAGIAHELNTPIGNAVTVASTLQDKTTHFATQIAGGELRRSALNDYVGSATTASDLLLRNLDQARNLVASFKQVAVDQTSDQRRRFDLAEVIGEVITTLSPTLRKTPYRVSLEIPDGIVLDSYPGPLGQTITNFVTNALVHAFEGRSEGSLTIGAVTTAETAMLTITDDGIGIAESDLKRVFDPFFTTKLGKGGSGLGLNIVYNIVTRILGGRIEVHSTPGAGTTFMLTIPLNAPDNAATPTAES